MAEDKPADKKPSRREAMYSHPRSAKPSKPMDDELTKKPDDPKAGKKTDPKGAPDDDGDSGPLKGEFSPGTVDEVMGRHQDMMKRQEKERRDMHASHRGDHRAMADRHEAEIAAMMSAGTAPAAGETAPNDGAAPAAAAA